MRKFRQFYIIILLAASLGTLSFISKEPWTEKQLISPSELANILMKPGKDVPVILSIGPSGLIKNAIDIGAVQDKENYDQLKKELADLPKDKTVVIYCGCCPFGDCPNIRPVFSLLTKMKFSDPKLLNLPKNLKVDWIDKGYPMEN